MNTEAFDMLFFECERSISCFSTPVKHHFSALQSQKRTPYTSSRVYL